MGKKVSHLLILTLGEIGGKKSHDIYTMLVTWIDEEGRWHVHPKGIPSWEGIGTNLDLALLESLKKRFE